MNFDLVASPDQENEMQEFRLAFVAELPGFRLVRFRIYTREAETAHWEVYGEYKYPDLCNTNTLQRPMIPQWAKDNAKTALLEKISFE